MALRLGATVRLRRQSDHISIHTPGRNDVLCLLDDPVEVLTHYVQGSVTVKGRSVACDGDACPHCVAGLLRVRSSWYAPALLQTPDGWRRVVLYIPSGAADGMSLSGMRGRVYRFARCEYGSVLQCRTAVVGICQELREAAFPVLPFVENVLRGTAETAAECAAIRRTLSDRIIAPVIHGQQARNADLPTPEETHAIRVLLRQGGLVTTPLAAAPPPRPKAVDTGELPATNPLHSPKRAAELAKQAAEQARAEKAGPASAAHLAARIGTAADLPPVRRAEGGAA